jgi:hypothetical protein
MSKIRSDGLPAAAMCVLSGEISSLLTCDSGWLSDLMQMPDGASQNLIV